LKIEIIHKNASRYEALQMFAKKHKLTFHKAAWLANFDEKKINQCAILNNNNDVIGCFLYYKFRKMGFDFLITPPYTPSIELFYLNPSESVVSKTTFDKDVMQLIADYFDSLKASYKSLYLPNTVIDIQPLLWKGFKSGVRYTYQISLLLSEEVLLANLSSEKRKSINRAAKDALEIKQTDDFVQVEKLVMKSLSRQSVDKNIAIVQNIFQHFSESEHCVAFLAFNQGRPSGASVFVVDKDRAVYLFGGFDDANKHHGAGVSCMWHSILKAKQMGLQIFDFEGSMIPGIERYYREFGGNLTPYFKIEKAGLVIKSLMNLKGVGN